MREFVKENICKKQLREIERERERERERNKQIQ